MPECRISTVGQERRVVEFEQGETLGSLFGRVGVDIPQGAGVEVWVNGTQTANWRDHLLADQDAVVIMPNLKGAMTVPFRGLEFTCRLAR